MKHDIPDHLIPDDETALTVDDDEKKLNEQLDTDRWVYTEEPDDGLCPYCGKEYEAANWASRVKDAGTGVCPYDTSISDFITQFVHRHGHSRLPGPGPVKCFCGPAYDDELITYPAATDYDIRDI